MRTLSTRRTTDRPVITSRRFALFAAAGLALILGLASGANAQLKAAAAAASTVTLSWTAPGDDGNTGTAALYDLRYSRSMISTTNWNDWNIIIAAQNEPLPQPAGTIQYYTVNNLLPSTTYYFAIRAGDEAGNWSGLSNVVSVTTSAESTPPAAITDLRILSSGDGSFTLGWTAPGDDSLTGTASSYMVKYSTSPVTSANWTSATTVTNPPVPGAPGTAQTVTVSGLQSGVTYYFAVKTADEIPNWSGLSNVVSGATAGDTTAPNPISDLEISVQ